MSMNAGSGFKDHFSAQAADYARFRPSYPDALIEFVANCAPHRACAVDCATGNGQAAVALARYFTRVIAVDASSAQLAQATPHPHVDYRVARAEALPVDDGSAALVVAAQACHWFDVEAFHAECRRVLAPEGAVAVWAYETFRIEPPLMAMLDHFYRSTLGPYWPPERRHVESGYRTLSFPWREIAAPPFAMSADWTLEQLLGYLGSWSAVQRYRAAEGRDPLPDLARQLATAWPAGSTVHLVWPVHLRLGRR
jgi:SAM-dependent methyltransferase